MTVALLGDGPAASAARAALQDADTALAERSPDDLAGCDLIVAVGDAGAESLAVAGDAAVAADVPLVVVERGGLGGERLANLAAGVSILGPDGPCYECLRTRVASTDQETDGASLDSIDARLAGAIAGREAVRGLDGDLAVGAVIEIPHARRTLLPVPGCETCGGDRPDGRLSRDHRDVSLAEAAERAERAVDARLGPVTVVGERESYPAPYYLAQLCDTSAFSDAAVPQQAAGASDDWNEAYVKAVGEALERYAAGVYRESDLVVAPQSDLDGAVSPAAFVRPSGTPLVSTGESLAWVRASHLGSGQDAYLPAEFVHFPPPEERFRPAITTGLGLGTSPVDAAVSGLREVIERDATMLAWYSTFEPLGLAVDDSSFDALARRARAEGLEVTTLLLTQDVDVPVVACAVHGEDWPRFAAGSAASLDATDAARGALAEALQNWMELRAIGPEDAADAGGAIGRYADFPREVRGFVDPETTVDAADVGPEEVPSGAARLDALVERAAAAGVESYASRLTPRDVASLGFEAVRVVAPRAQPLFVGESYFGDRAREVPRELGFSPRLDRAFHPFP